MNRRVYFKGSPPTPRLYHCPEGSRIILKGEYQSRTINHIEGRHAVMSDGLVVTLCHPVNPDCMKFGDGDGWRPA